jgi:beta-lactamase class D
MEKSRRKKRREMIGWWVGWLLVLSDGDGYVVLIKIRF